MRNFLKSTLVLVGAMSGGLAACSSGSQENASSDEAAARIRHSSRVHVMPVERNDPKGSLETFPPDSFAPTASDVPGPAGAHLTYQGGPVLSNVKIYTVYWGASVANQSQLNTAYGNMVNSEYFDWLAEYNTPTQTIGRGTFGGSFVDTSPPAGNVTDAQIQTELARLIHAGNLPPNDGNNLYMFHFPPGVTITGPGGNGTSCVQFCAYHGTFAVGGSDAFYGVVPDLGGACGGGCGPGSLFDNTTMVASHEVVEAVTDAAVGLATNASGPPLAWYDNANGEIGDICAGPSIPPAVVNGVTVQLEWSNQSNLCIATRATTVVPDAGADTGVDSGSDAGSDAGSDGGTGCQGDTETEPNDTPAQANPLNASMCGSLSSSSDRDYFTWSTGSGRSTYDLVLAADANATIKMWKKVGSHYRHVSNTSATEISHTTTSAGTYIVLISSPSGTVQNYNLTLSK